MRGFAAIALMAQIFLGGSGDKPGIFDWQEMPANAHYMIAYWNPPYTCNTGNYAVYCESHGGKLQVAWVSSEEDALKWADSAQLQILGIYKIEPVKLSITDTEKHEKQPDKAEVLRHYRAIH